MGLWDKLSGEFIDIIEWTEPSGSQLLAYRFPRHNNEIKYGAKLTVREGQAAVFVNEGQIADVFAPGMYTLETANLPILGTLKGWKYGFQSPFKAEVYFISTKQWVDQKWGTQAPVMVRDPEFGPVRLRAFGSYAMRVSDPAVFLRQLVATDPSFETFDVSNQLRNIIVSRFVDIVGQSKLPILDYAGKYQEMGNLAKEKVGSEVVGMGITLTQFYIENVSLPKEVEDALDARSRIGVLGNLDNYTKIQTADAIRDAAKNPGGLAGAGAGIGVGVAIGQQMGGALHPSQTQQPTAGATTPPPLPNSANIFLGINGKQEGPFDMAGVAAKIRSGQVDRSTLVWKSGMAAWAAAGTLSELNDAFAAVPPALPTTVSHPTPPAPPTNPPAPASVDKPRQQTPVTAKPGIGIQGEPLLIRDKLALRVRGVEPGSPAAKSGLEPGDMIIGANGGPLETASQLDDMISRGDKVVVIVVDVNTGRTAEVPIRM